jgi:hypothetical protein
MNQIGHVCEECKRSNGDFASIHGALEQGSKKFFAATREVWSRIRETFKFTREVWNINQMKTFASTREV